MAAHRRFVDEINEDATIEAEITCETAECVGDGQCTDGAGDALLDYIYRSQIGCEANVRTAFGERLVTFADYTASGRALEGIEDFVRNEVLPVYANTHTTASATGMQTTLFRAEARSIVRRALGCENNRDAVLFTGTGCTGAIGKMLDLLKSTHRWKAAAAAGTPPLVLVGPYEHHSNLLPWRESGCLVISVQEADAGGVDMEDLERVLTEHKAKPLKIGTFSAASNLTGILCDTVAISIALHRHGALAFFDYATAGPYTVINMNPVLQEPALAALQPYAYKDAVFLSPHKFVGGVATPGILAFKKHILDSGVAFGGGPPPALPGGGTVFFVTQHDHRYLGNLEEREEAGTPDIVGAIRCGLAMRLKEAVGVASIMAREHAYWQMAKEAWGEHPAIHLLGNVEAERLAIVSLNIRKGRQYLHHNLVAALLNDLFGIQVRAGCSCAGPYAQSLLGIDYLLAKEYEAALLQGDEAVRPGVVRLNFNYFLPRHVVLFIIRAVLFVAEEGWKLLPLYTFIPATGEWRHRSERKFALRHRSWLSHVRFPPKSVPSPPQGVTPPAATAAPVATCSVSSRAWMTTEAAEGYLRVAASEARSVEEAIVAGKAFGAAKVTETQIASEARALQSPEAARLRWFMLPSEAVAALKGQTTHSLLPGGLQRCATRNKEALPCVPQRDGPLAACGAACGEVTKEVRIVCGFEMFARGHEEQLLARHPHASFQQVLQVSGEAWRSLTEAQRLAYASAGASAASARGTQAWTSKQAAPLEHKLCEHSAHKDTQEADARARGAAGQQAAHAPDQDVEDAQSVQRASAVNDETQCGQAACEAGVAGGVGGEVAGGPSSLLQQMLAGINADAKRKEERRSEGRATAVLPDSARNGKGTAKEGAHPHAAQPDYAAGKPPAVGEQPEEERKEEEEGVQEGVEDGARLADRDGAARKKRADKAQKKLMGLVGKALLDFGMIKDGDRVMVGLSGGKDSMSLLHILMALQKKAPIHFEIGACTVDPQTPEYDPSLLKTYLRELGVPYFYESHGIIEQAACSLQKKSICSFCSRMKRGILYSTCKREGYGVLALGQHLDDQAESLLMSAFHNGQLRTMKANYVAEEHGVRVIRPLNYCREHLMREFAHAQGLPVITENCPGCFEAPKERARIKMVLAQQEQIFPDLYSKLLKAMLPLMAADCADPNALALRELQASKHAAERSFVQKKSPNAPDLHEDGAAAAAAVPSTLPAASQQQSDPSARALLSGGQRHQSLRGCAAKQVPAPTEHSPNSPPRPPEKTGGGGEKDRHGGGENEGEGHGEKEGLQAQRRRVRSEIQEMKRLLRQKEAEEEALTETLTSAATR